MTTLSPVDAAWLRMDRDVNPLVITALLGFAAPLDPAELRALVGQLAARPRFRERAVPPRLGVGPVHWEEDPHFDPLAHLHHLALPAPADEAALAELLGDLASTRLDPARPLWQLYVVDGPGAGQSLVLRVHHALGDGVALVGLLRSLVGGAPARAVGVSRDRPIGARALARATRAQAQALGELLLLPRDAASPLKGAQSTRKRLAWSRALQLGSLAGWASTRGAKVNDVLAAAVAASLADWMRHHGGLPPEGRVRALVPVFLRGAAAEDALGNHFGLVFLPLPLVDDTLAGRLDRVRAEMDRLKASPQPTVAFGILGGMGMASEELESLVVDVFARKASLLLTNVAGPPEPVRVAGRPLEQLSIWAPVAGEITLSVSLVSYAGEVRLGVAGDAARVPDPERIVAGFEAALHELEGGTAPEASAARP